FYYSDVPRHLHSFPTRRSSDLERRRFGLVRLTAREATEERSLRHALRVLAHRRVGHRPVDREPEVAPQLLELLLVLGHEPVAQLDRKSTRLNSSHDQNSYAVFC